MSAPFPSGALLPTADAGGVGNGATSDGGLGTACQPGNVETFVPAAYVPALPAGQGACVTAADNVDPIQVYYDDCFPPNGSRAACDAFGQISPAYAACEACIVTAATAPAYGPLILADGFVQENVAGCLELKNPSDLLCAQAQQALSDCELYACSVNCPVSDQPSLDAYHRCAVQADATGCQAYYAAAQCLGAEAVDGSAESACLASSFEAYYQAIVPLFCGQVAADAGPVTDAAIADAGAPDDAGSVDATSDANGDGEADAPSPEGPADASVTPDGATLQDAGPRTPADGSDAT